MFYGAHRFMLTGKKIRFLYQTAQILQAKDQGMYALSKRINFFKKGFIHALFVHGLTARFS
jgi:hypothetical protein